MPNPPLVRRGKAYFCGECSHRMETELPSCASCGVEFGGVLEEKPHPEAELEELEELDEEIEERGARRSAWLAIAVFVALALLTLLVILLLRR